MSKPVDLSPRRGRRLPNRIELELAKLLGTLGFDAYGSALWNLASAGIEATRSHHDTDPIPSTIVSQIVDQAHHDPAVMAVGEKAIPFLPRWKRSALHQHGIDAATLFQGITERVDAVVVTAELNASGDLPLAAIVTAFPELGARSVAIIVTDQEAATADTDALPGVSPPAGVRTVFWRSHTSKSSAYDPRLFALLLHALGPAVIVVSGSRLGLDAIGRYGRALRRFHRMFCAFSTSDPEPPKHVRHLRAVSPHAAVIAGDEASAVGLRKYGIDPNGPGMVVLQAPSLVGQSVFLAQAARIFGTDFTDQRTPASSVAINALLASGRAAAETAPVGRNDEPTAAQDVDVTVTIVFHREGELAIPALASLADMVRVACAGGLRVEARALLDRPDAATRRVVTTHGAGLVEIEEVSFGDLSLTRNAGTAKARGTFSAFVDGDDLWGPQWLLLAYRAATAEGAPAEAIWHPEVVYIFNDRDFDVRSATDRPHPSAETSHFLHISTRAPDFDARGLLLENTWSANAFAPTEIFRRYRYRANDWSWQTGIEDWRWNLETLGGGIPHLIVAGTVHIIRTKETGSLSVQSNAKGLLPILA